MWLFGDLFILCSQEGTSLFSGYFSICKTHWATWDITSNPWKYIVEKEIHISGCVVISQLLTQTTSEPFTCVCATRSSSLAEAASSASMATGKQSYLLFQSSIVLFSILIEGPHLPCSIYFNLTCSLPGKMSSPYFMLIRTLTLMTSLQQVEEKKCQVYCTSHNHRTSYSLCFLQ